MPRTRWKIVVIELHHNDIRFDIDGAPYTTHYTLFSIERAHGRTNGKVLEWHYP